MFVSLVRYIHREIVSLFATLLFCRLLFSPQCFDTSVLGLEPPVSNLQSSGVTKYTAARKVSRRFWETEDEAGAKRTSTASLSFRLLPLALREPGRYARICKWRRTVYLECSDTQVRQVVKFTSARINLPRFNGHLQCSRIAMETTSKWKKAQGHEQEPN